MQKLLDDFTHNVSLLYPQTSIMSLCPRQEIKLPCLISTITHPVQHKASAVLHAFDPQTNKAKVQVLPFVVGKKVIEHRMFDCLGAATNYVDGESVRNPRYVASRWNVRDPQSGRVFPLNRVSFAPSGETTVSGREEWHDEWIKTNPYLQLSHKTLASIYSRWNIVGIKGGPEFVSCNSEPNNVQLAKWNMCEDETRAKLIRRALCKSHRRLHSSLPESGGGGKYERVKVLLQNRTNEEDLMVLFIHRCLLSNAGVSELTRNEPRLKQHVKARESWYLVCDPTDRRFAF